jgi:hypothetical protein
MKHQTVEQLQTLAEINPKQTFRALSRTERLERWADLLEREPDRCLGTLAGTEYARPEERDAMRSAGSPITVAFDDPYFRAAGLENDSYSEAKRFFQLSHRQLHNIVCYCHLGSSVRAASAARHVRSAIGLFARLKRVLAR